MSPRSYSPLLFLATLLAAACAASEPVEGARPRLRVLSYNIHHGEGLDGRFDLERLAAIIAGAQPDLVALQEVDVGTRRSGGVDQAARLAELTGMAVEFGANLRYQDGLYGNAVLYRGELAGAPENMSLPQLVEGETRGALVLPLRLDGQLLFFCGTHFDYRPDEGERVASAELMLGPFRLDGEARPDLPAILAGDLNDTPGSRAMSVLFSEWRDAGAGGVHLSYPADGPDRRIDYVLVRPEGRWAVREYRVLGEGLASDHRPVLCELELLPEAAPRAAAE